MDADERNYGQIRRGGEIRFLEKWKPLGFKVDPRYYRLFSAYIGACPEIVPEDICHHVIEPVLNPRNLWEYYSDKNTSDRIFPAGFMPRTLLRRISGDYYDAAYRKLPALTGEELGTTTAGYRKIVVKPSVGTCSGIGVRIFERAAGEEIFRNVKDENEVLTVGLLEREYGSDFIVQEFLPQSDFMGQFNPSSVNTLRMLVYRSVETGRSHCLHTCIRIGKAGSVCDNAHMGGVGIGVSPQGVLGKYLIDTQGVKTTVWNGIDYAHADFVIPDFDRIKTFAEQVGDCIPHHRCLNLDVMIDQAGNPRLIEVNYNGMGVWLYQFTTGPCFGRFTDEIIAYCVRNKHKIVNSLHID